MNEIEDILRKRVEGEVRFDQYTRTLYSTDASIYDITPIGVVLPKSEQDVVEVHKVAHERKVAVLPRGGGSSLSGQAIGDAVILDFTRYLSRIVEINPEEKWARVQPGVTLDDLNRALKPHGLKFGPDPASGSRAAIGGMIGNNSTGAHSIIYGMTSDHVLSLKVAFANGEVAVLEQEPRDGAEPPDHQEGGLLADIERGLANLAAEYGDECRRRFPALRRNVAGYSLLEALTAGRVNVGRLICGSEGTLATVLEAKLGLVELPKATGIVLLCFHDLIDSLRPVPAILKHEPSSLEVADQMLLDLARESKEHGATARTLPDDTQAILVVEFYGDTEAEIRPRLEAVRHLVVEELGLAFEAIVTTEPGEQRALWDMRKAGLPILLSNPQDAKPTAFVEDTAVPPECLPDYISDFLDVVRRHGTTTAVYAHAGGGCLHMRPVINLKSLEGVEEMATIAEEIMDLAVKYGGTTSSEHGDGMVRTQWLEKLYGPRIVEAFRKVKQLFDPHGIMNPGKIVAADPDLRRDIRHRPGQEVPQLRSTLRFENHIDFLHSVELCNGCGGCRNMEGGTMCPSFRGTGEEVTSTRGRANMMRQALTGKLPRSELTSREFKEQILDVCLGCKACKRECPSGVDLARLKAEIKYQHIQEHGPSMSDRFFGYIDGISRVASAVAPIVNWANRAGLPRLMMEKVLGIDRRRSLPDFHRKTFVRWFRERRRPEAGSTKGKVAFFYDCYLNHNDPRIGQDAVNVLEALGYEVILADRKCCGRAMLSVGMLDEAREKAVYNVRHLSDQIRAGYAVVGCEPSCMATFRDDYVDLLDPSPELDLVRENTFEFMEFLDLRREQDGLSPAATSPAEPLVLHGHCQHKAIGSAHHTPEVLRQFLNAAVIELDSGCCGMAGSFGYFKKNYDLSMSVAELLFEKIRAHEGQVVASGVSCRSQIEHGMGIKPPHPVSVLAEHFCGG